MAQHLSLGNAVDLPTLRISSCVVRPVVDRSHLCCHNLLVCLATSFLHAGSDIWPLADIGLSFKTHEMRPARKFHSRAQCAK